MLLHLFQPVLWLLEVLKDLWGLFHHLNHHHRQHQPHLSNP
jgi:hypothetical protein